MLLGQKLEGGRRIDPDNGLIMPWYTSPCLEWLKSIDISHASVFEYGVGDSTAWYRTKARYVRGVDSDKEWALKGLAIFTDDPQRYIETPLQCGGTYIQYGRFWDIIVIDGDHRDLCTSYALMAMKSGGILIIDNWKQKSADLEHWPLTEKLIEGMPITIYKEPDHEDWQTAVIIKP